MEIDMTELQKTNVFNMAILSVFIIGVAVMKSDPKTLAFLLFPVLVGYINWKNI